MGLRVVAEGPFGSALATVAAAKSAAGVADDPCATVLARRPAASPDSRSKSPVDAILTPTVAGWGHHMCVSKSSPRRGAVTLHWIGLAHAGTEGCKALQLTSCVKPRAARVITAWYADNVASPGGTGLARSASDSNAPS